MVYWSVHVRVQDVDLGGPKQPCIRWGSRSPMRKGTFEGKKRPVQDMPYVKLLDQLFRSEIMQSLVVITASWHQSTHSNPPNKVCIGYITSVMCCPHRGTGEETSAVGAANRWWAPVDLCSFKNTPWIYHSDITHCSQSRASKHLMFCPLPQYVHSNILER